MKNDWLLTLKERWSAKEGFDPEFSGVFELKHMLCMPDGNVYFLSYDESLKWLEDCKKPVLKEIREWELYALFDEEQVLELEGESYIVGPVVILSELYPELERDLHEDELVGTLKWLEEKTTRIQLEYVTVEVFMLDERGVWL